MKISVPNNRRAVLWDLDGTIVDSTFYHKLAWQETFAKRGLDFTEGNHEFTIGRRNEEIIRKYIGPNMTRGELNVIAEQKEETFRAYIKDGIRALPRVVALIKSLAAAKFKLAIVSSATKENIQLITETLFIKSFFSSFITGNDVIEGKPNPQGFLLAAKKLGVQPENCIVIEDAVAGVKAAKRAGMFCIAVTNTCSRDNLAEADIVVNSLEEISVS
jgi:beta-phosphoglucomutase family hydrolase